ncbi:MAG: ATP-dependent sacrificial sulfur transferase LarE [bacterium]
MSKIDDLRSCLKQMGSILIAFSGGVDSTFLLKVAHDVLGEKVLAVIGESPTFPQEEVEFSKNMSSELGVRSLVIKTCEFQDPNFVANNKDRCYYCKSELFSKLKEIAKEKNIPHVLDGSNFDDKSDYRPGSKASAELGVRSPLQELGFTKEDIRKYSKELGLVTWDKPSYACLSSRIPYGTKITQEILDKVGAGERFLKSLGFRQLRVRHHDTIVRIEIERSEMERLNDGMMERISKKFEQLGYLYVTLDLKGYRTGSMNQVF